MWPRASARATQALPPSCRRALTRAGLSGGTHRSPRASQTSRSKHRLRKVRPFLSILKMQKDPGPRELGFGRNGGRRRDKKKKKSLATAGRGGDGRPGPSRGAGGARGRRCPSGPCLSGARLRGRRHPQGARERQAPIGPASAGRKGLGGLPGRPQKFAKGISKMRVTPAPEESSEWSCCGPNPGGRALPADFFPAAMHSQVILRER